MSRAYNFCAGPAAIPEPVLRTAKEELLNWGEIGASIMEMSHRSEAFLKIAADAEQDLRDVMHIPDNYRVLFLQGGASTQFAAIPMNLLHGKSSADYVRTGIWSNKAVGQAEPFCNVNLAADTMDKGYNYIPDFDSWNLDPNAAYLHYAPNETIGGVEFNFVPDTGDVPIVADMSSNILSRPVNVSDYGIIYAGAQKNIGPSGITIVIVRDDLLGNALPITPTTFDYKVQAENNSLYNTPPTFAWYMTGLVFKWLKEQGGPEAMAVINERKAKKLYAAIDATDFYTNDVKTDCCSWMNVLFQLIDKKLDDVFVAEAATEGLLNLNGWRTVVCQNLNLHFHKGGVDNSGKCNIIRSESNDDVIHGAVYQFDASEKGVLDQAEDGYHQETRDFGEFENVLVYFAKDGIDDNLSPYSWYQDIVIAGAQHHGFPEDYIAHISSFKAVTDPDQEREQRHRSIVWPT